MRFVHHFCNGKGRTIVFHTQTLSLQCDRVWLIGNYGSAALTQVAQRYFSCLVKLRCIFPQHAEQAYP